MKKKSNRLNKRGANIPGPVLDYLSILAFAIMMVVFYLLFKSASTQNTNSLMTGNFAGVESQQDLVAYLKTNIDCNGVQMTVADCIIVAEESKATIDILNSKYLPSLKKPLDDFVSNAKKTYHFQAYSTRTLFNFNGGQAAANYPSRYYAVLPMHNGKQITVLLQISLEESE